MTATEPHHTINYRILNFDFQDPHREVEVHAAPEEIAQFARDGYFVRERLFRGEALERLRAALDDIAARERGEQKVTGKAFGGLFLRHLMDKHAALLGLLKFAPLLSVARAMLGPQVQVRGLSARITYPGEPNQETQWHFHQRVVPQPVPPLVAPPSKVSYGKTLRIVGSVYGVQISYTA